MRLTTSAILLGTLVLAAPGCGSGTPSEPVPPSQYALEVRWLGDAPAVNIQQAFNRASTRIRSIITGGLTPVALPANFNIEQCDAAVTGFPNVPAQTVQGLIIYVLVEAIDGPGGVLGSAGPCLIRDEDMNKPALGLMRLDEEDLATLATAGRLDALILHETLHVVGFGTIWSDNGLVDGLGGGDARFNGPAARAACATLNGGANTCATTVPVHSEGGEGSAYSHWRETTFSNELMTPTLGVGPAPLSAMSIRSLEDLGYEVSVSSADAFLVQAGLRPAAAADETAMSIELPEPRRPRFRLSPDGTLRPFQEPR